MLALKHTRLELLSKYWAEIVQKQVVNLAKTTDKKSNKHK